MSSFPPPRPQVLSFLRDIKEHPDDDTPRLIPANWLENQGRCRGAGRGNALALSDNARPE